MSTIATGYLRQGANWMRWGFHTLISTAKTIPSALNVLKEAGQKVAVTGAKNGIKIAVSLGVANACPTIGFGVLGSIVGAAEAKKKLPSEVGNQFVGFLAIIGGGAQGKSAFFASIAGWALPHGVKKLFGRVSINFPVQTHVKQITPGLVAGIYTGLSNDPFSLMVLPLSTATNFFVCQAALRDAENNPQTNLPIDPSTTPREILKTSFVTTGCAAGLLSFGIPGVLLAGAIGGGLIETAFEIESNREKYFHPAIAVFNS